ncbi:hypothetical protein CTEN210_02846 [Chaetoceros tenuissimus]|uniref:RING-type domain-containing protein n=1 Tax=Chaetoceros tenuissimus TaxID=426638 RepID=A0AAD3CHU8_9STRA|nr:hypothetical protein CTEN210_02846 [Chaetoceros tenuissimus]
MESYNSTTRGATKESSPGSMANTSTSSDRKETPTTQENDGQEMVMPDLIPVEMPDLIPVESEIERKYDHLYKAYKEKDWDAFEKFLSDDTISKAEKKIVLLKHNSLCCSLPIANGVPIIIIQKIIDCLEDHFFGKSGCYMLEEALLNSSDELAGRFPLVKYTTVSYDVVELLLSLGGANLVYMQCLYEQGRRSLLQQYLGWNGKCPRIIKLLLKVCGLDLLELQDEDGLGIMEFTNRTQRDIIIDYLQGLDQSPRVRKHIESLTNTGVTPKVFFQWIDNCEFDRVREYLVDEDVSKEAKMKCITTESIRFDLPFHKFCQRHGPVDIAKLFVEIMGTQFLKMKDGEGSTCLHSACHDTFAELMDIDFRELNDEDFDRHHDLIEFILSKTGWKFLLETNINDYSALGELMRCLRTDLKCVKLVMSLGGKEILDHHEKEGTILHYASDRDFIDVEVIKYLVSIGGPKLMEAKDHRGKTAESMWPTKLKEYINLGTKTLPELCDDMECPICFDIMNDVYIITKCCHRFCKYCITQSYEKRGNKCPVCRAEFSFHTDIRKDPLLGKFAMIAKEKDDRNVALQLELSEAMQREHVLKEQNRSLAAELLILKQKYSEM